MRVRGGGDVRGRGVMIRRPPGSHVQREPTDAGLSAALGADRGFPFFLPFSSCSGLGTPPCPGGSCSTALNSAQEGAGGDVRSDGKRVGRAGAPSRGAEAGEGPGDAPELRAGRCQPSPEQRDGMTGRALGRPRGELGETAAWGQRGGGCCQPRGEEAEAASRSSSSRPRLLLPHPSAQGRAVPPPPRSPRTSTRRPRAANSNEGRDRGPQKADFAL